MDSADSLPAWLGTASARRGAFKASPNESAKSALAERRRRGRFFIVLDLLLGVDATGKA